MQNVFMVLVNVMPREYQNNQQLEFSQKSALLLNKKQIKIVNVIYLNLDFII
jgi:hypothetical protein